MKISKKIVKMMAAVMACAMITGCGASLEEPTTAAPEPVWKITQFNSLSKGEESFYTIISENGGLIVIDGGEEENEEIVRKVIEGYGGRVKAWILTNPDPKHIGAFVRVYRDLQGITVDSVYDAFIDRQRFNAYGSRPAAELYDEYLALIKDDKNVVHMNRDAYITVCGLKITCFNSYDQTTELNSQNLCRDGSLMLKIAGKKQSWILCGDITPSMEAAIKESHEGDLDCDIVTFSNHGNDGLTVDFYKLMSPSIAFIDGFPSKFAKDGVAEGCSYEDYKKFCEENNVTMYDLTTAPNKVEMK